MNDRANQLAQVVEECLVFLKRNATQPHFTWQIIIDDESCFDDVVRVQIDNCETRILTYDVERKRRHCLDDLLKEAMEKKT